VNQRRPLFCSIIVIHSRCTNILINTSKINNPVKSLEEFNAEGIGKFFYDFSGKA